MIARLGILLILLAPGASALEVQYGCTRIVTVYECTAQSYEDCDEHSAVGAGVGAGVGAAFSGSETCAGETFVLTASAGPNFVNAGWSDSPGSCYVWAYANSLPFATVPCPPGGMPNPGWGYVLP